MMISVSFKFTPIQDARQHSVDHADKLEAAMLTVQSKVTLEEVKYCGQGLAGCHMSHWGVAQE